MRLIDKHILSETATPFFLGIFAVIIMLLGNTLFGLVDIILKNRVPITAVARLVIFNIPSLLVLTMPVGIALAGAIAVGKLSRESEITAMRMAMVPLWRIFMPIFATGAIATILTIVLNEKVTPWYQREFQRTQMAILGYAFASSPELAANQVLVDHNYNIYIGSLKKDKKDKSAFDANRVLIIENPETPNDFPSFFTAQSASYKNGIWTLRNVVYHAQDANGFVTNEAYSPVSKIDMTLPLPAIDNNANALGAQPDMQTMAELKNTIEMKRKAGLPTREDEVAYYFKLSLPFLCFIFSLCAPPLSMLLSKSGAFTGVFLSILMIFVAWNTMILAKALGINGYLPPAASAWATDIIFGAIGLMLLRRIE